MADAARELLTIGAMAQASGATSRAIRFYEGLGLIGSCERSRGGHRLFKKSELDKLNLVVGLRKAGLSIKAISDLFATTRKSRTAADAAKSLNEMLKKQAVEMAGTARALRILGSDLELSADILTGCYGCEEDFGRLSCGDCDHFTSIPREGFPVSLRALWPMKGYESK